MGGAVDPPFFGLLLNPCSFMISSTVLRLRWMLSRPLETRLLPKWMTIAYLDNLTMGDVLLAFPLVMLIFLGAHASFINYNTDASGYMASYAMFAVFLTANKGNNLLTLVLGIPFERLIGYHMFAALTCILLSCFHVYVADRVSSRDGESITSYLFRNTHNTSGSALFLSLSALVTFSIVGKLRRLWFEIWLYSHILLTIAVFALSILHKIYSIYFFLGWWVLDVVIRYVVMAGCKYRMKANLKHIRPDVVQITFQKKFNYNPGQFVQICIPKLSNVEFHPVSISSAPHEDKITLHLRGIGQWSKRLGELVKTHDEVDILLEGPYGQLRVDIDNKKTYKIALLVSGGIGVTHCQSVGKHLVNQMKCGRQFHLINFVWAVRSMDLVEDMPPMGGVDDQPNVKTDIYCTQNTSVVDESLGYKIHSGRPDFQAILLALQDVAIQNGESNVAVFGCGPQAMLIQLQRACRKHTQSIMDCGGVDFDLHLETFEL